MKLPLFFETPLCESGCSYAVICWIQRWIFFIIQYYIRSSDVRTSELNQELMTSAVPPAPGSDPGPAIYHHLAAPCARWWPIYACGIFDSVVMSRRLDIFSTVLGNDIRAAGGRPGGVSIMMQKFMTTGPMHRRYRLNQERPCWTESAGHLGRLARPPEPSCAVHISSKR